MRHAPICQPTLGAANAAPDRPICVYKYKTVKDLYKYKTVKDTRRPICVAASLAK